MKAYLLGLSFIGLIIMTIRAGLKNTKTRHRALELFTNSRWIINIIIIVLFVSWTYHETRYDSTDEANRTIEALKQAIVALNIAILAEVGLTITPFWLVFMVAYYLEGWS